METTHHQADLYLVTERRSPTASELHVLTSPDLSTQFKDLRGLIASIKALSVSEWHFVQEAWITRWKERRATNCHRGAESKLAESVFLLFFFLSVWIWRLSQPVKYDLNHAAADCRKHNMSTVQIKVRVNITVLFFAAAHLKRCPSNPPSSHKHIIFWHGC